MKRGYFGIGVENIKYPGNIGTLFRSAYILGASFVFVVGERYKKYRGDTIKTWKHMPQYYYNNFDDFYSHMPKSCKLVGIEINDRSRPLKNFVHPGSCVYVLGSEDKGLSEKCLSKCNSVVQLPGDICMNVSVAGSIVMYDRESKK